MRADDECAGARDRPGQHRAGLPRSARPGGVERDHGPADRRAGVVGRDRDHRLHDRRPGTGATARGARSGAGGSRRGGSPGVSRRRYGHRRPVARGAIVRGTGCGARTAPDPSGRGRQGHRAVPGTELIGPLAGPSGVVVSRVTPGSGAPPHRSRWRKCGRAGYVPAARSSRPGGLARRAPWPLRCQRCEGCRRPRCGGGSGSDDA